MNYFNSSHDTIKFTYEHSKESIDFLDITLYKENRHDREQKLDVKPFFKKTNKFQYLQYSSAHPKTTFSSLIKGEMTRLLRACSDEQVYRQIQNKMYDIFRDRNYPPYLIRDVQRQVGYHTRPNIITQKEREQCPYDTFLVTEYTSDLDVKKLKSIITQPHRGRACTKTLPEPEENQNTGKHSGQSKGQRSTQTPRDNTGDSHYNYT